MSTGVLLERRRLVRVLVVIAVVCLPAGVLAYLGHPVLGLSIGMGLSGAFQLAGLTLAARRRRRRRRAT